MITTFQRPVAIAARAAPWFQWSSRLKPPKVTASYSNARPVAAASPATRPGRSFHSVRLLPTKRTRTGARIGGTG